MYKLSKFIVEKKILFFFLFSVAIVFSVIAMQKVKVNYDLTKYLPDDSETKIALDVMEEEFGLNGVANVIVANISVDEAISLKDEISQIEGVLNATFENTEEYYKNGNAFIKVTLKEGDYSLLTEEAVYHIKDILKDYEITMSGSSVHNVNQKDDVEREMTMILAIAIPIIVLILFLSANSYAEILVFGIVVGTSVLINKGTNLLLGEISYVTDSIAIVLQLALAMDYSIILLHRFEEEKINYPINEAIIHALKNSMKTISASSLTTIFGLISIMFMKFSIGYDIGIVLAKGIVCSLIGVFFFMPGVLLLFNNLIEKTRHKSFIPNLKFIHKYIIKTRLIMPFVFMIIIALAFVVQRQNTFQFSLNNEEKTEYIQQFGKTNTLAIIVPKGAPLAEERLITYIKQNPNINSVSGIEALGLRDQLSVSEFASVVGLDSTSAHAIFGLYLDHNDQTVESIEINALLDFMIDNSVMLGFANEELENINQLKSILILNEQSITYQTLANLLGFEEQQANMIYALYEMSLNEQTYKLIDVLTFMLNQGNQLGISDEQLVQLNQSMTLIEVQNTPLTSAEFATVIGLTEQEAYSIYTLYEMSLSEKKYGITDLFNFMSVNQATLQLSDEQMNQILEALQLYNYKTIPLSSTEFAQIFGMSPEDAGVLYYLYNQEHQTNLISIEFGSMINYMVQKQATLNLTEEKTLKLMKAYFILNNVPHNVSEFANVMQIPVSQSIGIYGTYSMMTGYQVTSHTTNDMIHFMIEQQQLLLLDETKVAKLHSLIGLFQASQTDLNVRTFKNVLNLDEQQALGIYASYAVSSGYQVNEHELNTVIDYIISQQELLQLTNNQLSQMTLVKSILDASGLELTTHHASYLLQLPDEQLNILYSMYSVTKQNPRFQLLDLVNFIIDQSEELGLTVEQKNEMITNKKLIDDAFNQFESDDYSRILFNMNLNSDDEEALTFIQKLRTDLSDFYDEFYVLGDSANILDIKDSFNQDVFIVNMITIVSIFIILVISFKSIILPILLILVIQGSIWINFTFSALANQPIIFMGYIIVIAIQMGATIDYAIVMTDRYKGFREQYSRLESIKMAIHVSLPTLITSGGILIVSGFTVGLISSVSAISDLGILMGRGALISCLLVLFLLPQFLIVFDKVVYKKGKQKQFTN